MRDCHARRAADTKGFLLEFGGKKTKPKNQQQNNLKAPKRAGVKPRQEQSIGSVAAGPFLSRAGGTAAGQDPCCGRGAGPITTLSQGPSSMDRQWRPSGSEGGLLAVPCHPAPSMGSSGGDCPQAGSQTGLFCVPAGQCLLEKWLRDIPALQPGSEEHWAGLCVKPRLCKVWSDSLAAKCLINIRKRSDHVLLLARKSPPAFPTLLWPWRPSLPLQAPCLHVFPQALLKPGKATPAAKKLFRRAAPACWVSKHFPPGANHLAGTVGAQPCLRAPFTGAKAVPHTGGCFAAFDQDSGGSNESISCYHSRRVK